MVPLAPQSIVAGLEWAGDHWVIVDLAQDAVSD
ncbi:hypothetical protein HEMA109418_01685 [Helcobacillus massiliensis]|uniref:Uncharacterized protein n=1 Tax=Helcobacillus massiliensis TaxID=521392 RepID=A0A839R1F6_9MICO|nr:hypothetical protein [Helcobacillus massiliensis]